MPSLPLNTTIATEETQDIQSKMFKNPEPPSPQKFSLKARKLRLGDPGKAERLDTLMDRLVPYGVHTNYRLSAEERAFIRRHQSWLAEKHYLVFLKTDWDVPEADKVPAHTLTGAKDIGEETDLVSPVSRDSGAEEKVYRAPRRSARIAAMKTKAAQAQRDSAKGVGGESAVAKGVTATEIRRTLLVNELLEEKFGSWIDDLEIE